MTDFLALPVCAASQADAADSTGAQISEQDRHLFRTIWQVISNREWAWRTLFYLSLAAPLLVSGPLPGFELPLNVVWPRIHSGDEPHYLVILNSLIRDGDMDLANNYASVHAGGTDAGLSFAGQALDHHVSWYEDGQFKLWWKVFEKEPENWSRNSSGVPVPTLQKDQSGAPLPAHEYSWHPPGVALILALPTYPFRGTDAVESIALVCTTLVVIVASLWFEVLIAPLVSGWQQRLLVTMIAFLGTPIWHYGRTLFNEPYLLCFALAAYGLALRYERHFAAGACIALGIWMKPPFALLFIPLGLRCFAEKRALAFLSLVFPLGISVGLLLWMNQQIHGSVGASSTAWQWGNMITGSFKLFLSFEHGIIPYSPIVIAALACIPRFFKKHFSDAAVLVLGFALYFGLLVNWISWHGGFCYGPRMVIPVLPFLFVPICSVFDAPWAKTFEGSRSLVCLACCSIVFNAIGAFGCGWVWGRHPAEFIACWISG